MTVCPICAEPDTAIFHRKAGREPLICRACRHVFWSVMPSPDEVMAYYRSVYSEFAGQLDIQASHADYYRSHARDLARDCGIAPPDLRVADIGCWYPVFLSHALDAGASVACGVDWS